MTFLIGAAFLPRILRRACGSCPVLVVHGRELVVLDPDVALHAGGVVDTGVGALRVRRRVARGSTPRRGGTAHAQTRVLRAELGHLGPHRAQLPHDLVHVATGSDSAAARVRNVVLLEDPGPSGHGHGLRGRGSHQTSNRLPRTRRRAADQTRSAANRARGHGADRVPSELPASAQRPPEAEG